VLRVWPTGRAEIISFTIVKESGQVEMRQEHAKVLHGTILLEEEGPLDLDRLFWATLIGHDDEEMIAVFDLTRQNGGMREAHHEMPDQDLQFGLSACRSRKYHDASPPYPSRFSGARDGP